MQSLDIGDSIQGGLAVVFLAVYLDRVTAALGSQRRALPAWWPRWRRAIPILARTRARTQLAAGPAGGAGVQDLADDLRA